MNENVHRDIDNASAAYKVNPATTIIREFRRKYARTVEDSSIQFETLSVDMMCEFKRLQQKKVEFDRKMSFCNLLKKVIKRVNPTWIFNIVPTGSSVTGLATENSDLDVAIHIPQAAFIALERMRSERPRDERPRDEEKMKYWREIQLDILQIVRLILKNDKEINGRINWEKGVELVMAQIQILKLETIDGVECDISVVLEVFLSSMHNSFLIRQLSMCDYRFAPLCFVVKQWAASTGVKDPKDGGFNSYALVLLVIHFLQCGTSPPILPNLMSLYARDKFIAQSEDNFPEVLNFGASLPRPLPRIMDNDALIASLFFEFIFYYSKFDFATNYISIKNARTETRNSVMNMNRFKEKDKQVYIEDPFDSHNPGRTVRKITHIKKIMEATIKSFQPEFTSNGEFVFPTFNDILKTEIKTDVNEEEREVGETGTGDEEVETGNVN